MYWACWFSSFKSERLPSWSQIWSPDAPHLLPHVSALLHCGFGDHSFHCFPNVSRLLSLLGVPSAWLCVWMCIHDIKLVQAEHLRMFYSLTTHSNGAHNLNLGSVQWFDSPESFTFVENCQQLYNSRVFPPPWTYAMLLLFFQFAFVALIS